MSIVIEDNIMSLKMHHYVCHQKRISFRKNVFPILLGDHFGEHWHFCPMHGVLETLASFHVEHYKYVRDRLIRSAFTKRLPNIFRYSKYLLFPYLRRNALIKLTLQFLSIILIRAHLFIRIQLVYDSQPDWLNLPLSSKNGRSIFNWFKIVEYR